MLGGWKVSQPDAPGCAVKVSFEDLKPAMVLTGALVDDRERDRPHRRDQRHGDRGAAPVLPD
jgi:hypothetical protein